MGCRHGLYNSYDRNSPILVYIGSANEQALTEVSTCNAYFLGHPAK